MVLRLVMKKPASAPEAAMKGTVLNIVIIIVSIMIPASKRLAVFIFCALL